MLVEYDFKVRWGDTDAAGIVFYPNFYKWMDEATHEYLNKSEIRSNTIFETMKINVPLVEALCQFKKPLFFEDQVTVKSVISELHRKVFKISHEFYKGEDCVAQGYEIRAWTSFLDTPKAMEIPMEIRYKMISEVTLILTKK
ncbi:acyl-CoA thioesterase [Lysinibacillus endophyticus]|uniref:acyl-CoA thioesterase n=1 Tax=Ureibacillus endophyticus TaxID=1978490 RepID=UPI00209E0E62|nr:thioesterase family protein [Lysinibacillus endophyticus]MCP1145510.1 acyl-CoA thioesterase [Lysinibacillus endophyticus]